MTSGQWITYFLFASVLVIFPIWELLQLLRRRLGNESALTMSQYVTRRAKKSKKWAVIVIAFPILILLVAIWLIFHWEGLCISFGLFCNIDV